MKSYPRGGEGHASGRSVQQSHAGDGSSNAVMAWLNAEVVTPIQGCGRKLRCLEIATK